jgi:hypothetical protein
VTFPINLAPLDPARVAWVLGVLDAGAPIGSRERETIRAALVQLSGLKFAPDYVRPHRKGCECVECDTGEP